MSNGERIERFNGSDPLPPCREMMRFRDMLDAEGVPWHDDSDPAICRTHSNETMAIKVISKGKEATSERMLFSVINGEFTYGGHEGLLEVWMPWMADPQGHYTAEGAMELVRKAIAWDGDFMEGGRAS